MRRILILAFVFTLSFSHLQARVLSVSNIAPGFEIGAEAVYLFNLDTDSLIWERNSGQPMYPASLTKMMTTIIAMENTADLDSEMVLFPNHIQDHLFNFQQIHGSISLGGMIAGDEFSMRDMIFAMMLPSANEAAMSVAHHIGGSQEDFVEMMNQRARQLGATNTNFVNATGLYDPNHISTARDIFIITKHAMGLDGFAEIASTIVHEASPANRERNLVWNTTNHMMIPANRYFYPHLSGIKTGTLPQAGRCFVSTATRDGFTYILVVMGSPFIDMTENAAFYDTRNIYEWVFNTFRRRALVEQGRYVTEIPLRLSMDRDHLQLMTAERVTALMPAGIDIASIDRAFDLPDRIDAPVTRGEHIGTMTMLLDGEELGRVDLLAGESISANPLLVILDRVREVVGSFWFRFTVIFILLLILAYAALMIRKNKQRRRRPPTYKPRRRV